MGPSERPAAVLPASIRSVLVRKTFSAARVLREALDKHGRRTVNYLRLLPRAMKERRLVEAARRVSARSQIGPPLVSVVIATYNRADLLLSRAIRSALEQDYPRVEVVVVGDRCTDDTEARIRALGDHRVRFENLAVRGPYPSNPEHLHKVAGVGPINRAIELARGEWVAHLDDDEEFTRDHVSALVSVVAGTDAEVVWGRTRYEMRPGQWAEQGTRRLSRLDAAHSAIMFRTYLRCLRYDPEAWKFGIGADHHLLMRMRLCGVRTAFVDRIITVGALRPGTTKPWAGAEDRAHL